MDTSIASVVDNVHMNEAWGSGRSVESCELNPHASFRDPCIYGSSGCECTAEPWTGVNSIAGKHLQRAKLSILRGNFIIRSFVNTPGCMCVLPPRHLPRTPSAYTSREKNGSLRKLCSSSLVLNCSLTRCFRSSASAMRPSSPSVSSAVLNSRWASGLNTPASLLTSQ